MLAHTSNVKNNIQLETIPLKVPLILSKKNILKLKFLLKVYALTFLTKIPPF
jgi:hypothetical protein